MLNEPADIAQAGQGDGNGIGIAAASNPPLPIQPEKVENLNNFNINLGDDKRKKRVKVIMDQVNEAAIFARITDIRSSGVPIIIQPSSSNYKVEIIQMNKECRSLFTKQFLDSDIVNQKVFR